MKRDKNQFYCGAKASSDEGTPSESSSAVISGTSSPNYMKATSSSSARKGSLQASLGTPSKNESPTSSGKSTLKISKVSVQDFTDPSDENIPVKVETERKLKRVPSLKQPKKLSSKQSMKIRAQYSQFPDIDKSEMLGFDIMGLQDYTEITSREMEIDAESLNDNGFQAEDFMIGVGEKQKDILERSRSRKLTRIRSIRSARTRQILSGVGGTEVVALEAEVSNAEPHYTKTTTSQQARANPDKSLERTTSLTPLRILPNIPSLRPRSKEKKRPQATPVSGIGVHRPTCSSALKQTQFPDDNELHSREREMDRTSFHLCPYSYCSIHGHCHHTPSQPLNDFIVVKRKLFSNQKGKQPENQSRGGVTSVTSASETDHSEERISTERYAVQEVMNYRIENAPEDEDNGNYAKPTRKWVTEGRGGPRIFREGWHSYIVNYR